MTRCDMNAVQIAQNDRPQSMTDFCEQSHWFIFPFVVAMAQKTPWKPAWVIPSMCISSLMLADFYQTRKFVVDNKINYADIARFTLAVAWAGMFYSEAVD
jgi:hypothetical protein